MKMLTWKNYFTNLFLCNSKKLMQCNLSYIPERLHFNGNEIINKFYIGEELYYRCNLGKCQKPYQGISLYDISHNRNFKDSSKYPKEDVLFDINESSSIELIPNKEINTSVIKSLNENGTYEKIIFSDANPDLSVNIKLIHTPLPCMYPHCSFQISFNGTVLNKENYDKLFGKKKGTAFKNLRRDVRQELTSLIYSSSIDNESEVEIITEL